MKVRRKIVALGTALAMAFVMIASLVMVTDVKAVNNTPIASVNFKVAAPVGEEFECNNNVWTVPRASIEKFAKKLDNSEYRITDIYVVKRVPTSYDDYEFEGAPEGFDGKVSEGKTYYLMIDLAVTDGYEFNPNGLTTNLQGQESYHYGYQDPSGKTFANLVVAVKGSSGDTPAPDPDPSGETVPVKDGYANQTVAPGSAVTIGFDTAITNFVDGTEQGLVYIDGTEVPSQYITATEGSTIITVAQEYLSQLAEGTHKMVVKFLDNTEGEASFTISSSAAASADGTTASSGTASSTAATTTTKATAAKTADALPYAGLALVFVGASAIGVIAFRRKNS